MAPVDGGMDPPIGVTPNFSNPDKSLWTINIITQCLCMAIVSPIVFMRLYTKMIIRNLTFGSDDWTCFLGWTFAIGYSAIALTMSRYGGGIHQWEVPKEHVIPYAKLVYGTMVVYGPCALCIKSSILLFLAKIFEPHRMTMYICVTVLAAYYLPVIFLKAFICRPVEKFWSPSTEGKCFDQHALILADSVISVVSDILILILPMPMACQLQTDLKKKIKVGAVFSAGGIACITTIARLVDIIQNSSTQDQTYAFMHVNLWGIAEVNIGLICACVPLLPALWKHYVGKSSTHDTNGFSGYHSTERGIEMLRSTHKSRLSATRDRPYDTGSDENVLIGDKEPNIVINTSVRGGGSDYGDEHGHHFGRRQSNQDLSIITRTIEVRQTSEQVHAVV